MAVSTTNRGPQQTGRQAQTLHARQIAARSPSKRTALDGHSTQDGDVRPPKGAKRRLMRLSEDRIMPVIPVALMDPTGLPKQRHGFESQAPVVTLALGTGWEPGRAWSV